MNRLENPFLLFECDPETQSFALRSRENPEAEIIKAGFDLELAKNRLVKLMLEPGSLKTDLRSDPHKGELSVLSASYRDPAGWLRLKIEFALCPDQPFLYQRLSLTNIGRQSVQPERVIFGRIEEGDLRFSKAASHQTAFFSNGWQSWSPSGTWQYGETQARSRLTGLSTPMLYYAGTPQPGKASHFSSDMFAAVLDRQANSGLLLGFLSQKQQFGSLTCVLHPQAELAVWANCDQIELLPEACLTSDWLVWQFFEPARPRPFTEYLRTVAKENQIHPRIKTPVGWCSWYYYFQKITPQILRANLRALDANRETLPIDFFQIDDGFEQDVGSWLKFQPAFPDGISPLIQEARQKNFTPGIWLAPFILEHRSELIKEHPDWLLRKPNGKPVNSGFVWNWLGKALDLTLPGVQDYVRSVIRAAVREWGVPYLKLDFLYAAALPGRHADPTLTRAQVLRKALELIREEAGDDSILLGCGAPIGTGLGIFDIMRVSADVSPAWDPEFLGIKSIFRAEPNMPSARNAIRNILTRANLDPHLWVNDPDCLLVRDDSKLTLPEVQSLASAISLTGGAILISDDMSQLNPDRLKLAASLLPPLPPNPVVVDLFEREMPGKLHQVLTGPNGTWHLIALFNWEDQPSRLELDLAELGLDQGSFLLSEFWTGEVANVEKTHSFEAVPAHGVCLLALRPYVPCLYLGSDLHLSQGVELKTWQQTQNRLSLTLDLQNRRAEGSIRLWCERKAVQVTVEGKPVEYRTPQPNLYVIPVSLNPSAVVELFF